MTKPAIHPKYYWKAIRLYPNPADDYLIIKSPHKGKISKVTIIGMNGEVVKLISNVSGNENKVSLQGLTKGTYLIQIEENNQITTGKFVKQ